MVCSVHRPPGYDGYGARLQVDDQISLNLRYERYDAVGCYAGTRYSENLHVASEQGGVLKITTT